MNTHHIYHQDWRPPHCPNPDCKFHNDLPEPWPCKRIGFFYRQAAPHRIRRFLCKHCRVSFSSQTFSTTYYLKRPDILPQLMTKTVGCMANRQIATDLKVSPTTIDNQLNRLGRHCLLFHEQVRQRMSPSRVIAVDGFESFELSQYFPFYFHLAVDCRTGMFLHFTDSPLRRKGSMTARQKARRQELEAQFGRPDPRAVRRDMQELLETVTRNAAQVTIRSDAHKSYPPAIRAVETAWKVIRHEVTSSRDRRDQHNALYEINLLDLLLRHGSGNHKRETIAWSKRRQGAALRLAVFLVWRNYVRPRWTKKCEETPAMEAGLFGGRLTVEGILGGRLFVSKVGLAGRWREYYWGEVETAALGVNRRHELKRAA